MHLFATSRRELMFGRALAVLALTTLSTAIVARSQELTPGNLVVSRSVYSGHAGTVSIGEVLPPNCSATTGGCAGTTGAVNNGVYPYVFNNDTYDASFGITSPIFLDELTPSGDKIFSIEVPNSLQHGVTSQTDQLVTSFSSKSELALHLSTDSKILTFMGYVAPVNAIDLSNSNTPGVVDPTNPVGENAYRAVATMDKWGHFAFTETNAYSGNNGRAAVLNSQANVVYTAGNAGNGGNPQPNGVILGAGAQFITPAVVGEYQQNPGTPTPVGSFSVAQLGVKADKIGKDDNFRGIGIYKDVVYFTKGSGGNGVNTLYFIDTTGTACPAGVGLPVAGAKLPTAPITPDLTTLQTSGLPNNMCVLAGFPSTPNKTATVTAFPFSFWFANDTTLYVADEGDGTNTYDATSGVYTDAAAQTTAGLQKWIFNSTSKMWTLAYTLQTGLNLGKPYHIDDYPGGTNPATALPWAPATDGLRNITGKRGEDGKVALYAISSTVSGGGDQGADPNKLFMVLDDLGNTSPTVAATETFHAIRTAKSKEVLRGVSFTPGTQSGDDSNED